LQPRSRCRVREHFVQVIFGEDLPLVRVTLKSATMTGESPHLTIHKIKLVFV
jgi:hypothetical protein